MASETLQTLLPPPPAEEAPTTTVAALTDDTLRNILHRLAPADLLRAALACHRWRRAAARCAKGAPPPLLGYFFHPADTPPPVHLPFSASRGRLHPAAFSPVDASSSSPRLSLDYLGGTKGFIIYDVYLGLVLLLPTSLPSGTLPRILVLDPASRRRALLPQPPRDALPGDRWRGRRHIVGAAVLSRAHPSRLCFDAVCLTVDDKHPRAWVASYRDGECSWRALPRDTGVTVAFDPYWFEGRCVHAAGDIYWHICHSGRLLKLDPATLSFSYLLAPSELGDTNKKFRIGETPEDGRLGMATVEDQEMQFWVRGEATGSDNGWFLRKRMNMRKVLDSIPGLPRDMMSRIISIWLSDIDAGRTGKLFIKTQGYGRYSFHMDTGKLERLATEDGKEYGHPIYAYYVAWPPAFLAPELEIKRLRQWDGIAHYAATRGAALAFRRCLSLRLFSHSSASASLPLLLGHFHHPRPVPPRGSPGDLNMAPNVPAFQPLTPSSPRLSLDFVPDLSRFTILDSHLGLLLLRRHDDHGDAFLACDPVSRRHALFHPPPTMGRYSGGTVFSAALLSREADAGGLRFEAVCVAVDADAPRAWVATCRDGDCRWRALPRSRDVAVEFDPYWLESHRVRAAGSIYWHICNNPCALALDAATLQFSFLRAPAAMWDSTTHHKYRVGESPVDGRLCVASLERDGFQLWVRGSGEGSDHGWVLERHVRMQEVLDAVPWLPRDILIRHAHMWLSDIDAGRTGKVFIASFGYGRFSYHIDTGKLECLSTDDGMQYGHPIFPYFSAPSVDATGRRAALTFRRSGSSPPPRPLPPPRAGCPPRPHTTLTVPAFQPLAASSTSPRRLSLDFVPDLSHFTILDSHLGLLLLRHRERHDAFLVCDPVSRRHALFHPPPVDEYSSGGIFSGALLSRDDAAATAGGCGSGPSASPSTSAARAPGSARTATASAFGSREVAIEFDPDLLECLAVRAAGSLYWHIRNNSWTLALDTATLQFSFLRAPAAMWDSTTHHRYRVGEMPAADGRLCVASLEPPGLLELWVRGSGEGSDHGWVMERRVRMLEVLDAVPWLPRNVLLRHLVLWLSDIDAGRTGKVFIATAGFGRFSYHLDTGEMECLATEDGMEYGQPIFPYISATADG
uniref:F-box domain-containing protein n=1 Tax=Oryza meridionalis TaxID=40149 RepID=A0A0E0EPY0_9ORYZ